MCIAIFKPQGKIIDKERLKNCWDSNDDGAGFMYAENGVLYVKKGFMRFDDFYEEYVQHENNSVVLHFRIATAGGVNPENTHPFQVNDNLAFVHNGVIREVPDVKGLSDTAVFNKEILQTLPPDFLESDAMRKLIVSFIGMTSKLIFLDNLGRGFIFNPQLGEMSDGVWYSNDTYKRQRIRRNFTTGTRTATSSGSKEETRWKNSTDITATTKRMLSTNASFPTHFCERGFCTNPLVHDSEIEVGYCRECVSKMKCPKCGGSISFEEIPEEATCLQCFNSIPSSFFDSRQLVFGNIIATISESESQLPIEFSKEESEQR